MAIDPRQPIEMTVHGLPLPSLPTADARTRKGRLLMLLVLAICTAPVLASYFTYFVIRPSGRTNYSELVTPHGMPSTLPLRDLGGASVDPLSLRDQWLLVVVSGGACNADCEHALWLQRQLREALGRDRDRVDKLWLITDDAPVRPEVLRAVQQRGVEATVLRVPRQALGQWLRPATGHALEDHIYVVDPMGQWMMRAPPKPEPAKLKGDIEKLLRASAGWDKPGRPAP